MLTAIRSNPALLGSLSAVIAVVCFSVNDVVIKFLSGGYALHQVVLIRAIISLVFLLTVFRPLSGGWAALRTRKLGWHIARGACVVMANMTFFLGLAAMPLAEGVAIFFVSPLLITVFSVIFLREIVGPLRWSAIFVGLLGVLIVLRPGTAAFQWAALLPMLAAFGYAALHILTRHIGKTESALALAFYIQVVFIVVALAMGLMFGRGQFGNQSDPSLAFLFRAWVWPDPHDLWIFLVIGATSVTGGYFISVAYRISEAALVAPFEYAAMPLAVVWGLVVFGEWPDSVAMGGIALILGSGLFMIWRETLRGRTSLETPKRR
ncbi:DMT family transporter [Mesobacterium sp. TK19101]|uniref:DMT family transporter n=1 Tax=Mesobacterium hydrothermale TaxID=3111907 RepID=A0ABU6HHU2_9RHOB|nr:DMT family transporter [Mesobacterium sp. TK19101]MEC3860705.1 DMT family transporter [Mesobacterium sp. TK19101]